jgi:hypothetical protein
MAFPQPTRPYTHPRLADRRRGSCHWCGNPRDLNLHRARDCPTPHKRCVALAPGRCLVPNVHPSYWTFTDGRDNCPYQGDYFGELPKYEHA